MAGKKCPQCQGINNEQAVQCRWCKTEFSVAIEPEPQPEGEPAHSTEAPAVEANDAKIRPLRAPARPHRPLPVASPGKEHVAAWKRAYLILYGLAGLELVSGLWMLSKVSYNDRILVGCAIGIVTGVFLFLGVMVHMCRSAIALGFGLILVILACIVLAYAVGMGGATFGGIFIYVSCIIPLVRAFPALQALQHFERNQALAAASRDVRKRTRE